MTVQAHATLPLLYNPELKFVHYATSLPTDIGEHELHQRYVLLLQAAHSALLKGHIVDELDTVEVSRDGHVTFSYNLALTADMMVIMPRRSDAAHISDMQPVFVNGTILAGTLMVKDEADFHELQQDTSKLSQILSRIGFSRNESSSL